MDGLSTDGPRVWITRSEPGAQRTAARLEARGYRPLVAPLIALRPLPFSPPQIGTIVALAFTSATAVTAFAPASEPFLHLPAFAVGAATGDAMRAAGFRAVRSAGADGRALATLLAEALPSGAHVLHPAATIPGFDLAAALRPFGIEVHALPVYETVPAAILPTAVHEPFATRGLHAVLVHSPAAARALARLLPAQAASALALAALSPACAAPLAEIAFAALAIASQPDEAALLDALDALRLDAAG